MDDCESIIYTLMGFVSRKRPIPQWGRAEDYYRKAIARGGSTNTCAARSYLSQLYWSRGPDFVDVARNETMALCQECANTINNYALVRQARLEFDRQLVRNNSTNNMSIDLWPHEECLAPPSMDPSSTSGATGKDLGDLLWCGFVLLWVCKFVH